MTHIHMCCKTHIRIRMCMYHATHIRMFWRLEYRCHHVTKQDHSKGWYHLLAVFPLHTLPPHTPPSPFIVPPPLSLLCFCPCWLTPTISASSSSLSMRRRTWMTCNSSCMRPSANSSTPAAPSNQHIQKTIKTVIKTPSSQTVIKTFSHSGRSSSSGSSSSRLAVQQCSSTSGLEMQHKLEQAGHEPRDSRMLILILVIVLLPIPMQLRILMPILILILILIPILVLMSIPLLTPKLILTLILI